MLQSGSVAELHKPWGSCRPGADRLSGYATPPTYPRSADVRRSKRHVREVPYSPIAQSNNVAARLTEGRCFLAPSSQPHFWKGRDVFDISDPFRAFSSSPSPYRPFQRRFTLKTISVLSRGPVATAIPAAALPLARALRPPC